MGYAIILIRKREIANAPRYRREILALEQGSAFSEPVCRGCQQADEARQVVQVYR
jgi:hypothetical protein